MISILALITVLMVVGGALGDQNDSKVIRAEDVESALKDGKPYNFDGRTVEGDLNLSGETLGSVQFVDTMFDGAVNFNGAIFTGGATFEKSRFSGDASFENAKFHGNHVNFDNAKFSGLANFKSANFSCNAYFDWAKFNGKRVYFKDAFFGGNETSFRESQFNGIADFKDSSFSGSKAIFKHAAFLNLAIFENAVFHSSASFDKVTFSGEANFKLSEFLEDASFESANFAGNPTEFTGSKFLGEKTDFSNAQFAGLTANFSNVTFSSCDIDFTNAEFAGKNYTNFVRAKFSGDRVRFRKANFSGEVASFNETEFSGGYADFAGARFDNSNSYFLGATFDREALFNHAWFSGTTYFDYAWFKEGASFVDATLQGRLHLTRTRYDNLFIRWDDIEGGLAWDDGAYFSLLKNFKTLGYVTDYLNCYMDYRKEQRGQFSGLRWFFDLLLELSYGYGKEPAKPIFWSIVIISICSLIFRRLYWKHIRKDFPEAIRFSISIFFSGTRLFVESPPKVDEKWPPELKALFQLERILGIIFTALLILAISESVIQPYLI